MKQTIFNFSLLIVLLVGFSTNSFSQEVTQKFYKQGKYWKEVPEKKADVVKTTTISNDGMVEEWTKIKNQKVFRKKVFDVDGIPVGEWIFEGYTKNYNFKLETISENNLTIDDIAEDKMREIRRQSQLSFDIPRHIKTSSNVGKTWAPEYRLLIKKGQLADIKLIKSSSDPIIDKEGARALMTVDYQALFSKEEVRSLKTPIIIKIR